MLGLSYVVRLSPRIEKRLATLFTPSPSRVGHPGDPYSTPCVFISRGALLELRAIDERAVPASAPVTSRLFVLPVAARRLVSTDNNTSMHFYVAFVDS